ncbi:MAG: metalloregulator ArsR/SmtB family transcription factor [Anaerolineales bacterium]|nr:metalloregulator ArsR/SmtB family transcription factor [Anaerolineales bacterium]
MSANIYPGTSKPLAEVFRLLGQQVRIQILLIIGKQEACVCHLVAVIGIRQATISQHLMALKVAELVTSHRHGRNIFYRLANPELLDIIYQAGTMMGISIEDLAYLSRRPVPNCPCPHCNPDMNPESTCEKIRVMSS